MVSKISIFQKVWEWLPLVWKLLGYLVVVFWSYLGPPNSHIIKNKKIGSTNQKIGPDHPSLLATHVGLYVSHIALLPGRSRLVPVLPHIPRLQT